MSNGILVSVGCWGMFRVERLNYEWFRTNVERVELGW